jgi:hypothetical protein
MEQQKLPTITTERSYLRRNGKKPLLGVSILYIFDLSIFNVLDMYKTPGVRMVFSFLHERGVAARSGVLVPILASFEKNLCDRSEDALTN